MASFLQACVVLAAFHLLFGTSSSSEAQEDILDAIYGLGSALSQAHVDPLAQEDTFLSLPPSLKNRLLQAAGNVDTRKMIQSLLDMQMTVPITVKLVGFSVHDGHSLQDLVGHFVDVSSRDNRVKVIGGEAHDLVVKAKAAVEVVVASKDLALKIEAAITAQIDAAAFPSHSTLYSIDYAVVDEILQEDLKKPLASYVIYLLNLKRQERSYAYGYTERDSSSGFSKCLGSTWTGKDRYLWIDLAAGPVAYGPSISGEGLLPKGEFHPLVTLRNDTPDRGAFVTDIASLVWSAMRMLLVPALRVPVQFAAQTEVHFIHIQASEQEANFNGINLDSIEKAILQDSGFGFLLSRQQLTFKRHNLKYSSCATCVAAISQSIRSYTARFHFENYTLIVNDYLDSKQLHFALRRAQQELASISGIHLASSARMVPIYIFDLDYDRSLWLDRYHQAMAFKDMVVAIRTKLQLSISEYTCNGRHIIVQSRELERPILGSLLQVLWGVTPTHLTWSSEHNSTIVDYTWAVGQTPFGPFSDVLSLSFVQRDSAPRNIILTALNSSLSNALVILQSVQLHGGEKKFLGQKRHAEFTQRWIIFLAKLKITVSALSHFDFNRALYFIQSSNHDLYALHKIVYDASEELSVSFVCFRDLPFSWKSVILPLVPLAILFYLCVRGGLHLSRKKKKF